jgi:hypothetical protein
MRTESLGFGGEGVFSSSFLTMASPSNDSDIRNGGKALLEPT